MDGKVKVKEHNKIMHRHMSLKFHDYGQKIIHSGNPVFVKIDLQKDLSIFQVSKTSLQLNAGSFHEGSVIILPLQIFLLLYVM